MTSKNAFDQIMKHALSYTIVVSSDVSMIYLIPSGKRANHFSSSS